MQILAGDALQKFMSRLRAKTEEQGADFISYDPSDGTWTFRVKHFSRYGLDDSDDDMDADVAGASPAGGSSVPAAGGLNARWSNHRGTRGKALSQAEGLVDEDEEESDP